MICDQRRQAVPMTEQKQAIDPATIDLASKEQMKQWRDQCLENWSFQSHSVPSWLKRRAPEFFRLCHGQTLHGLMQRWLPRLVELESQLAGSTPRLTLDQTAATAESDVIDPDFLQEHLWGIKPWRKGPWQYNDIHVKSEWNSSIKYKRLQDYGPSFKNKTVLDIGCGNGYYGFRMLGDGAKYVLGVDPAPLFWTQFMSFKHFAKDAAIDMLPIAGEPLETMQLQFDVVLSMGVLYHRRSPLDHIRLLKNCLRKGGEVLLETLVIDDHDQAFLMPDKYYAGMANVWGLPSVGLLKQWMKICGFTDIECVSLALTNYEEQQQTDWIDTHSLEDFLSECGTKTAEGYPAPLRVMIKAKKPE